MSCSVFMFGHVCIYACVLIFTFDYACIWLRIFTSLLVYSFIQQ